jgi:hypothetical protein
MLHGLWGHFSLDLVWLVAAAPLLEFLDALDQSSRPASCNHPHASLVMEENALCDAALCDSATPTNTKSWFPPHMNMRTASVQLVSAAG